MSASKNAILRYKTIDKCLRNRHRRWTLQDIVDECNDVMYDYCGVGISERTIQSDMQFMRSDSPGYCAPIVVYDKKYYTYSDPNFSILKAQIREEDVNKMRDAIEILRQLSGFQAMEGIEDVVGRLEDHVATIRE